ncbi:MAG: hypothetical protein A3G33_02075 [Omnitrophica bacterium RIFCSPLOWO2_12_FULL_44_17]|uniref:Type II secretion system protein GspF domain-containing protein n=1 Tax=Candidatus Danuiimicrobium aquiferis TaxID=1801832 RepID=A0A1G1KT38_9BACT|nr:MAG: hypothetical protein A3B72_04185 [Omnitrophica bacterium RIFCSPHIGHO2_02_FULL_45_28]OGW96123.1 MAG: hypothetical protein A3G33_02075 [Omnitrophica bacterium RIFCSPLOWO2_12_FULL_44_17]OGX01753.1 MAG: hypothetical protein A3J12_03690 [Omnitrophica bacterium RIFCSPLOWO2_02_FULL_44_11]
MAVPFPKFPDGSPHKKQFECRVRDRDNSTQVKNITVDANSKEDAIAKLQADGYLIVSVEESKASFSYFGFGNRSQVDELEKGDSESNEQSAFGKTKKKKSNFLTPLFYHVSTRDLISFAVQLSALLKAGIPLIRSIEIIQKGSNNLYLKDILKACIKNLSMGLSLSYALSEYPKVFPPIWQNLIEVGEMGGNLPQVLSEIAGYQESAAKLKSRVISAFFYPIVLSVLATAALSFLLLKIVPKFADIFKSQNMVLPPLTQFVVLASEILRKYTVAVALGVASIIASFVMVGKTSKGKFILDLIKLRIPIVGALNLEVAVARFCRGFTTLIRSGVPILQSLTIGGKLVENSVLEALILSAREGVRGGHGLGGQLESKRTFPVFMTQLISIGEEAGEMDRFLEVVAKYYEERVDTLLQRLATAVEPVMLVIMGAIIGVIVVSMFMPILDLSTGGR